MPQPTTLAVNPDQPVQASLFYTLTTSPVDEDDAVTWAPLPSLDTLQRSLRIAQRCGQLVDDLLAEGLPPSMQPAVLQVQHHVFNYAVAQSM